VENGFVYTTSGNFGGSPITLFCINASTGTQVWSTTGQFLTFAVANDYVYITQAISPNLPATALPFFNGAISCLNASTGVQMWYNSYGSELSTPVVGEGTVYVNGANFILALNALTGPQIWNNTGIGSYFVSPVLAGANLYAASGSNLYAFNANTGEKLWNYTVPGTFTSLIAANQNVYVECITSETSSQVISQSEVLALNASNGTAIWDNLINSSLGSLIVTNGNVYMDSGNGNIYALDATNGRVIWKDATGLSTGSSLLVNGYLYVGTSAGVYCFDSYTGAVIWKFAATDFTGSSATNPAYGDGVIYVGWNGPVQYSPVIVHNFYALDASNGEILWNYTIGYTVTFPPAVVDGTVYIGASYADPLTDEMNEMPGVVIALESNLASLPLPTLPVSEPARSALSAAAYALIVAVLALLIILAAALIFQKRLKTKPASTSPPLQNSALVLPVFCSFANNKVESYICALSANVSLASMKGLIGEVKE
jgi:outer membrane protein assembly factor BamB